MRHDRNRNRFNIILSIRRIICFRIFLY